MPKGKMANGGLIRRRVERVSGSKAKKAVTLRNCLIFKSPLSESNQRPTDYKSVALPAELRRRMRLQN